MYRTKQTISTLNAPKPAGPYSQGVYAEGFIFVAGQVGVDSKTNETKNGITAQTRQCLDNLKAVVEAAGSSLDNVVRVGVYLRNIGDFAEMNKTYETYFPSFPPARTTVQAVLASDFLVEIDAVAIKS